MYEPSCDCKNPIQINKWAKRGEDGRVEKSKYKAFTKRVQVWKEVARQAQLNSHLTAHEHYDKMMQVAESYQSISCSTFHEKFCVAKKEKNVDTKKRKR
jgi:hypothetical protein